MAFAELELIQQQHNDILISLQLLNNSQGLYTQAELLVEIDHVILQLTNHFKDEERIMIAEGYFDQVGHSQAHKSYLQAIATARQRLTSDSDISTIYHQIDILYQMLEMHIDIEMILFAAAATRK